MFVVFLPANATYVVIIILCAVQLHRGVISFVTMCEYFKNF